MGFWHSITHPSIGGHSLGSVGHAIKGVFDKTAPGAVRTALERPLQAARRYNPIATTGRLLSNIQSFNTHLGRERYQWGEQHLFHGRGPGWANRYRAHLANAVNPNLLTAYHADYTQARDRGLSHGEALKVVERNFGTSAAIMLTAYGGTSALLAAGRGAAVSGGVTALEGGNRTQIGNAAGAGAVAGGVTSGAGTLLNNTGVTGGGGVLNTGATTGSKIGDATASGALTSGASTAVRGGNLSQILRSIGLGGALSGGSTALAGAINTPTVTAKDGLSAGSYDPSTGNIVGDTSGDAAPAASSGIGGTGITAGDIANLGKLGISAYGAYQQRKAGNAYASQLAGLTGPAKKAAQEMLARFNSGQLTAADQQAIDDYKANAEQMIRQEYSDAGMSNSGAMADRLLQVDKQVVAMQSQARDNYFTLGMNGLGVTFPFLGQQIQFQMQQDEAAQQTLDNVFSSVFGMIGNQKGVNPTGGTT